MKNVIAIVAIVVIAILGLSSYNTNDIQVKKNASNSTLLAALDNGGNGAGTSLGNANGNGSGNKKD